MEFIEILVSNTVNSPTFPTERDWWDFADKINDATTSKTPVLEKLLEKDCVAVLFYCCNMIGPIMYHLLACPLVLSHMKSHDSVPAILTQAKDVSHPYTHPWPICTLHPWP
jgi:hypothetical protein